MDLKQNERQGSETLQIAFYMRFVIKGSRNGARVEWGRYKIEEEFLFCISKMGCHCIFVCYWI